MARKVIFGMVASMAVLSGVLGIGSAAGAVTTTRLLLGQAPAFAVLGHSCGGIQEKVYAIGFAANGYPTGDAYLSTSCGGSGRDGGGTSTTYTAWATVTWDWFGETRSYGKLQGTAEVNPTFSAEDSHHDRIYNAGGSAYLETTEPPVVPPAAPTSVSAYVSVVEVGEREEARFQVSWTPAPETAGLITSSKVVARPLGSTAPVLEATVSGGGGSVLLAPPARDTTYRITVTNTDLEGTSAPSAPIEVNSITPEEEAEKREEELAPKPPEFGRCVKATSAKEGTVTYYYGGYTNAGCTEASATHTGKYEWTSEITKQGFTTAIKPTTKAIFEATGKNKVVCTGESGSGAITGKKTVGGVQITFTGCESASAKCTTAGLAEGELRTVSLEGTLGIERTIEKEGREILYPALDLFPAGKAGAFLEYTCAGGVPATLGGSVIVPVPAGKMQKTSALKFAQTAGLQKPESFEEGSRDVLTNGIGEQVGLSLSAMQTGEEAVEINPVV